MFCITKDADSQYFVEPTSEYYNTYSDEFIKKVCPKYSYGQPNRICFCRIYYDTELNTLHLSHFNNYVRDYYTKNKINFEDPVFRGMGVRLLKSILTHLIDSDLVNDTKIMLDMVDMRNKKLIQFYQNLSFNLVDEDNFFSNIGTVLDKLKKVNLIPIEN